MNLDVYLTLFAQMNAKCTVDLRVRVKTKLLGEKNRRKSLRPQVRHPFLSYVNQKHSPYKEKKEKLNFKIKFFCTSKYRMKKLEHQAEKNIGKSDKGFILRLYTHILQ